ncbi:hypothetical protein PbJCM13498_25760 [Prolixibacter bellariivorans]|uniref:Membrane or secreted protein n=1 Tax=Prolixibacter bellariivorans TaxID=314319 RepID=A0A5M4B1N6_9BACT|nr:hypothetical protein [Prolixibacter bellariivorans]GET33713.1 hypothetical protein PbJCM13498_25760 [Prolixibacter bellariivorans]
MFLKIFLISIVLVAIVMLALGVKMLFDPKATFEAHSCSMDPNDSSEGCAACQVKEITDCENNEPKQIVSK